MLSTVVTELTVPLVAVKLATPTVPTTASPKTTLKVIGSFVTLAAVLSVTAVTAGAMVSYAKLMVLEAGPALPAASITWAAKVLLVLAVILLLVTVKV